MLLFLICYIEGIEDIPFQLRFQKLQFLFLYRLRILPLDSQEPQSLLLNFSESIFSGIVLAIWEEYCK